MKINEAIEQCKLELAMTFEIPARDIIAMYANQAGISVKAFTLKLRA